MASTPDQFWPGAPAKSPALGLIQERQAEIQRQKAREHVQQWIGERDRLPAVEQQEKDEDVLEAKSEVWRVEYRAHPQSSAATSSNDPPVKWSPCRPLAPKPLPPLLTGPPPHQDLGDKPIVIVFTVGSEQLPGLREQLRISTHSRHTGCSSRITARMFRQTLHADDSETEKLRKKVMRRVNASVDNMELDFVIECLSFFKDPAAIDDLATEKPQERNDIWNLLYEAKTSLDRACSSKLRAYEKENCLIHQIITGAMFCNGDKHRAVGIGNCPILARHQGRSRARCRETGWMSRTPSNWAAHEDTQKHLGTLYCAVLSLLELQSSPVHVGGGFQKERRRVDTCTERQTIAIAKTCKALRFGRTGERRPDLKFVSKDTSSHQAHARLARNVISPLLVWL